MNKARQDTRFIDKNVVMHGVRSTVHDVMENILALEEIQAFFTR